MDNNGKHRRQIVWLAVLFEGGLGLLAWGLGWWLDQPALETLHWSLTDAALGVAASLVMLVAFVGMLHSRLPPLARIRNLVEEVIRPLLQPCTVFDLALISLLAGLGEEMLFRGVLQPVLGRWLGVWGGLGLASLLFGLLHPITPTYVVIATLFGAYLGGVWLACDNLLVVIVAHGLYDFLVLVYLLRRPVRN